MSVSVVLHNLVDEWGGKPRSINEGECDAFANDALSRISSAEVELRTTEDLPDEVVITGKDKFRPEPWHVWITDGEKHYDAEAPDGVTSWRELPFFQRTLGLS